MNERVIVAPVAPLTISGIFASCSTLADGKVTPVLAKPTTATTFSFSTSSRATATPTSGLAWSSRMTSSIWRPNIPPVVLMSER